MSRCTRLAVPGSLYCQRHEEAETVDVMAHDDGYVDPAIEDQEYLIGE